MGRKISGFLTIDIETSRDKKHKNGLYGEPNFISWCDKDGAHGIPHTDLTAFFIDVLLTPRYDKHIIYAHAGFQFDYKRLKLERLVDAGFTGKIIADKHNNYKAIILEKDGMAWQLQDTLVKFPFTSLKKLLSIFCPDLPKLKLDLEHCEFDPLNPAHVEYAIRDSEGLYKAVDALESLFQDSFGVSFHASCTAPGLSRKAFLRYLKNHHEKPSLIFAEEIEEICRSSYFGGQTLALDCTPHDDVMALDIHGSYAGVMSNFTMPAGMPRRIQGADRFKSGFDDDILYRASVYCPEGVFPLLKSRIEGRAGNYAGHLQGWWWGCELALAQQAGMTITVQERIEWTLQETNLQEYMAYLATLVNEPKSPLGSIIKLLRNSLYGKFAAGAVDDELILSGSRPENCESEPAFDLKTGKVQEYLWRVPVSRAPSKNSPHWGSYITARARVALNSVILRAPEKILYCDTDSLFFQREHLPIFADLIGPALGQWGIESDKTGRFQAFGPKAYIIGELRKNKGIPSQRFVEILEAMRTSPENAPIPENKLLEYFTRISRVGYNGFNSMHKMQSRGGDYGGPTSRATARPENTTAGQFTQEGRWRPSVIDGPDDAQDSVA